MSQDMPTVQQILAQYVDAASAYGDALERGDSVAANNAHHTSQTVFDALDRLGHREEIARLLHDNRTAVRYWAAVDMLKFQPAAGELALEAIANGPPGPLRAMAWISLNQWREVKK